MNATKIMPPASSSVGRYVGGYVSVGTLDGDAVGGRVMTTMLTPDTPVTVSHLALEVAAALILAMRAVLLDWTEANVELTVLSKSVALEKELSASDMDTVKEIFAVIPSSLRLRRRDDDDDASVTSTFEMSEAFTPSMSSARPWLMAAMSSSVTALALRPSMLMDNSRLTVSAVVGMCVGTTVGCDVGSDDGAELGSGEGPSVGA
mmetsp:Transcript_48912/g.138123  ORF Transcript_48912/g.138123 Transcript_48912/m.138123 type:complete len:205 (-) Transcript_48912:237-851(-)